MTLGSHQKTVGASRDWITPRHLIDALGPFDLDPCASVIAPWRCAANNVHPPGNGLATAWHGLVWLNPPFDRYEVGKWVDRLARHGNGIALLHARTEAEWFLPVWRRAETILFLADRLYFHYPDGRRARANSGAPACLCAFGSLARQRLRDCGLPGVLVTRWVRPLAAE